MKNRIKNLYNSLEVSEEAENSILNKTIYKKKTFNFKKIGYSFGIFLLVFTISISLVYAKEIVQFFKNWSTGVEFEDGTKITGTLNGRVEISDWYYDEYDEGEDYYYIDTDGMYIHCEFQYTTDKGEYYLETIHNF